MKLVKYEAARFALQSATSIDEVKDIRDKAEAMASYARQAKDTELVELATELKVRAERRAGEMLVEMGISKGRPNKMSHDTTFNLSDLNLSRDQSSRWQKLAAVPEDKFEEAVASAKEIAGEVTTALMLRINSPHVSHNTGNNEWYTPPRFIEKARTVMTGIDLDPASSKIANEIVKAGKFYSVEDDGLKQNWGGKVWMNPPYAQPLISLFCKKFADGVANGDIEQGIVLVNNATDTDWLQNLLLVSSAVCFLKGRVRFLDEKLKPGAPLQGQVAVYCGGNVGGFSEEFSEEGIILIHA